MFTLFKKRAVGVCRVTFKQQIKPKTLIRSYHHSSTKRSLSIRKPISSQSHYQSSVIFGLRQRYFCNTSPPRATAEDVFNKNKERSESLYTFCSIIHIKLQKFPKIYTHTDHRQEIIENKEPNVSHPRAIMNDDETEYYIDKSRPKFEDYVLPHTIWTKEQLESIEITHKKPQRLSDKLAYLSVGIMRFTWDLSTGYLLGRKLRLFRFTPNMWLLRVTFLGIHVCAFQLYKNHLKLYTL